MTEEIVVWMVLVMTVVHTNYREGVVSEIELYFRWIRHGRNYISFYFSQLETTKSCDLCSLS
jgi:hypothetical protein